MIYNYRHSFAWTAEDIQYTTAGNFDIEVTTNKPIRDKPRRLTFQQEKWVKEEMDGQISRGKFRPVASPWATKVKLVDKDLTSWVSRYRMTIAYWRLN